MVKMGQVSGDLQRNGAVWASQILNYLVQQFSAKLEFSGTGSSLEDSELSETLNSPGLRYPFAWGPNHVGTSRTISARKGSSGEEGQQGGA